MNKTIEHHLGTVHVADCFLSIELNEIGSVEENKATVGKSWIISFKKNSFPKQIIPQK